MTQSIHIRAPCRLHFGMFGFGHADRPQFGGVGVMVRPPGVDVTITPAARFQASGSLAPRVERFAASALRHWQLPTLPSCEIRVRSPRDHVGLGVGTQLGLAVAVGLRRFLQLPDLPAEALAPSVGRGARSAVGTHGFQHGGLIVDAGRGPSQPLGSLARRAALPDQWRFVLICPPGQSGLAGDTEADAFARLPTVPDEVTRELWRLAEQEMLPAVERSDCPAFGEAVCRFGRLAGECFAAVQGGAFASSETAALIDRIRNQGIQGVAQSSWGPTVFAITASDAEAQSLADWLRGHADVHRYEITIAQPSNCGAWLGSSE